MIDQGQNNRIQKQTQYFPNKNSINSEMIDQNNQNSISDKNLVTFTQKNIILRHNMPQITNFYQVFIYPAFDDTFLFISRLGQNLWKFIHFTADGEQINQWQRILQSVMSFQMLDDCSLLMCQQMKFRKAVKITTIDIRTFQSQIFIHRNEKNTTQTQIHYFLNSQLVCIDEKMLNIPNIRYKKKLTYYEYPIKQDSQPIKQHQIQFKKGHQIKSFKVNNQSKIVIVNMIMKQPQDLCGRYDLNFAICNLNQIRECNNPKIIQRHQFYFPDTIVQVRQNILFIRYRIQNRSNSITKNPNYPKQTYGGMYFVFELFWDYYNNKIYVQEYDYLNKGNNLWFNNSFLPLSTKITQTMSETIIVDYDSSQQTQIQELYKDISQWKVTHESNTYIYNSFNQLRNIGKIHLQIKILKFNCLTFPPKIVMGFLLLQSYQNIDQDFLAETLKILLV